MMCGNLAGSGGQLKVSARGIRARSASFVILIGAAREENHFKDPTERGSEKENNAGGQK